MNIRIASNLPLVGEQGDCSIVALGWVVCVRKICSELARRNACDGEVFPVQERGVVKAIKLDDFSNGEAVVAAVDR